MQAQHPSGSSTEATTIPLKEGVTERGFPRIDFSDHYQEQCSLQLSSLADTPAIWFGLNATKAKVLKGGTWNPVDLPEGAMVTSRMHLSHQHVKALLPYLMTFVETGDLLPKTPIDQPHRQFVAEIKKTSKYASQANLMRNHPIFTYPFACSIDHDHGGDYVVQGGVGGRYRLADVNLYVVVDGKNIRIK